MDNKGIPNNLKNIRLSQGVSQRELSKKTKISRTIISGLETGKIRVTTTKTLEKLADVLNVDICDILCSK